MKKFLLLLTVVALSSCAGNDVADLTIIPYPNEVEVRAGSFDAAGAEFCYSSEIEPLAVNLHAL